MDSSVKPFTVIGGFLGAGKTTLLNRLLASGAGVRYAVLVNDFGAINIDERLVERHDGKTVALSNGCICCSMVGGFVNTMLELMQQTDAFDHIIVEASGVAEPDKIMDFARIDSSLYPEGIVVLVDASDIESRLADAQIENVVVAQLTSASILLLNKVDKTDSAALELVKKHLEKHNSTAVIVECSNASVPIELLFGHALPLSMQQTSSSFDSAAIEADNHPFNSHSVEVSRPIDKDRFEQLRTGLPENIVRAKGILYFSDDPDSAWLWQRTGRSDTLKRWQGESVVSSQVVLIASGDMSATVASADKLFAAA